MIGHSAALVSPGKAKRAQSGLTSRIGTLAGRERLAARECFGDAVEAKKRDPASADGRAHGAERVAARRHRGARLPERCPS